MSSTEKELLKKQLVEDLTKAQATARMVRKLDAFRAVYEKTDRIITGQPVRVRMAIDAMAEIGFEAAGWTDGETISLNARLIESDLGQAPMPVIVLHTKAINFHELCHILYTPRMDSDVCKWCRNATNTPVVTGGVNPYPWHQYCWYAFNALEDQRIEMLFAAKYPPAIPYFEAISLKWLVRNGQFAAEAFPLVYGRKFLPDNVRNHAEACFRAKYSDSMAVEFKTIIDQYLQLVFDRDTLAAQKLIRRYAELVSMMHQHLNTTGAMVDPRKVIMTADNDDGEGHGPSGRNAGVNKGRPRVADQDQARAKQSTVKPRKERKPKKDDDGDGTGEGEGQDQTDGEADTPTIAAGDSGDQGESGESDGIGADGSGEQDKSDEGEPGTGTSTGGSDSTQTVIDVEPFLDALNELFEDESFQQELEATARAIHDVMDGDAYGVSGHDLETTDRPVPLKVKMAAKSAADALRVLRTELEEIHHRRQTSGGIDLRRFMTRKPWEADFFRTYEPGAYDEASLEAVILVDLSGSMGSVMADVSAALWSTKRALEELDARVTVIGYSDYVYPMYGPNDRISRTQMKVFPSIGGTNPTGALQEAFKILHGSKRTMRLMLSVTDGAWGGDRRKQDAIISALNAEGVVTALLFLSTGAWDMGDGAARGHTIHQTVTEPSSIAVLATKIAREGLKSLGRAMTIDA